MERWFGNFNLELGDTARHKDLAHFHEAIAMAVFYYGTKRIHSALKISPPAYAATLIPATPEKDKMSGKSGG